MNMHTANASVYKQQQILTASPEQLILMLYNGCIKFMNEAANAIEVKDLEKTHNTCIKAQNIVLELSSTLNMDYPIAKEMFLLYDYVEHELILANLKKDVQHIENAKYVLNNIREGWLDAMKTVRGQGATSYSQTAGGAISI